jgi:hypothetical protein
MDRCERAPTSGEQKMMPAGIRTSCSIAIATALIAGCGMMKSRDQKMGSTAASESQQRALTVADVLAMGGRQITPAEARELFNGASWTGVSPQGGAYSVDLKGSGKYTGTATMADGKKTSFEGDWWVDDQGRHCSSNSGQTSQPRTECYYYFKAGDPARPDYYMSDGNASQNRVVPRRINK